MRLVLGRTVALCVLLSGSTPGAATQAQGTQRVNAGSGSGGDSLQRVADKIQVAPGIADQQIGGRLTEILSATGRFRSLRVTVRGGVVFLDGATPSSDDRKWAGDLARNTEGVAAVMNRFTVDPPSWWDFGPALRGVRGLERSAVGAIPFLILSALIVIAAAMVAKLTTGAAGRAVRGRSASPLLRDVIARGSGVLVFLGGLLVALRVAGLTTVALTVVGGTGVLGIILGIAFREISENLLASVFLSVQPPFRSGDLIQIENFTGFVQRLTVRATVLMTLDGNHVQIPNATVYKSIIRNYSSNPNRREDAIIGIGYDDVIADAQAVALKVLANHPAVLDHPEPWVLVDSLGPATVNLRVYFWLDGKAHSWLKVRSSVIRLVKRAFQDAGISMPDEAREVIFPKGVPVIIEKGSSPDAGERRPGSDRTAAGAPTEHVTTGAEARLTTEATEIREQALASRTPEDGEDLLTPAD